MAITAAICNVWKLHLLGLPSGDTYKIALYTSSATIGAATAAYTATGEVSGTGYTAGGQTLAGFTAADYSGTAVLDWTTDPSWANATITARGALIYNASQSNKAVAVLDFGADITSTNGTFTVSLPTPGASTGLIRIA